MTVSFRTHRFVRLAIVAVALALAATVPVTAQEATTYEVVSHFEVADGRPSGLIQTRNGQFFGTTVGGPPLPFPPVGQVGTVFTMDQTGARTKVHTFFINFGTAPLRSDGSPRGNLFEGNDGSLYGTTWTFLDSQLPRGQVFKISPEGIFTTLAREFALDAGVIQARDGRLYGVADGNQVDSHFFVHGYVYRVEANGTLTGLHGFGSDTDLAAGELVEADDGTLYGATEGFRFQPPTGEPVPTPGTIFRVDPTTGTFTIRHQFADGIKPAGRLVQGADGRLYGTTVNGGDFGLGTVFSLDAAGTFTTVHHFSGADGANPGAGVIQGLDGRLYGTTRNAGAFGFGTVFAIAVTGGLTTLHDFASNDGANPDAELFQASDGALYGSAPGGGAHGGGVVFRIRPATIPLDGYFEIVSRNSGKCLDVFGGSTDAVAPIIQWTCHGGPNQQWRLEPAGGGAFRIIVRHSGQALNVYGAFLDDITPIIQYPVSGTDNEAWTLVPASDGYVQIVARHSGKAMDVEYASTDDGARVIQFSPHGGPNQQWVLRAVESTAAIATSVSAR